MLEQSLVAFALLGAGWVLYLLVFLSIISIAIMIERSLFFLRRRLDVDAAQKELWALLQKGDPAAAAQSFGGGRDTMEGAVIGEGLKSMRYGAAAADEIMESELVRQKARYESRLMFLGTLGNNAPFIGLFGTVLGIIKAFKDLSLVDPGKAQASTQAVMAGISEALVATAVGLAVALPAVVAFNYFKSQVKGFTINTESLRRVVHAHMHTKSGSA